MKNITTCIADTAAGGVGVIRRNAIIQRKVGAFVRTWPRSLAETYRHYRRRFHGRPFGGSSKKDDRYSLPYWLLLPAWLAETYSANHPLRREEMEFLNDVLVGQYYLFLAVRIEDDLFDKQTRSRSLIRAARYFRGEAERIYAVHFKKRMRFWEIYKSSLRKTADSIRLADTLQQERSSEPKALLEAYAGVNALFKIGPAAVCAHYRRMDDYPMVHAFSDNFSIGAQILDDLADIKEDLNRDRWNYAANITVRESIKSTNRRMNGASRMRRALWSHGAAVTLVSDVERKLQSAFDALKPLRIKAAQECWNGYRQSLREMKHVLFGVSLAAAAEWNMKRTRTKGYRIQ